MTERRFTEAEVAAIFEQATQAQQASLRPLQSGDGMSLAEVQEIAREVGIAPELIVQAAKSLDQGGRAGSRSFFGLRIGVSRTIDLDRKLTDEEWERLVVDLRATFDAKGVLKHEGSFRQWTNGNLQVLLEPIETGHRVRFRTVKGDASAMIVMGLVMLGFAVVAFTVTVLRGELNAGFLAPIGVLGTMGVGMFGLTAFRLPAWARLRSRQMEEIAARLQG